MKILKIGIMTNWKDIDPDFTPDLQRKWEKYGFDYQQTKAWIEVGLYSDDYGMADWLRDQGKTPEQLNSANIEKFREEHWDNYLIKLDQEKLEDILKYADPNLIEWIKRGFSYQEFNQYGEMDLELNEYNFATYLQQNGSNLSELNIKGLKKEYYGNVQGWLEQIYPKNSTTEIEFGGGELEFNLGELIIADYPNLVGIYVTGETRFENITKVTITNCPQLKRIIIVNFTNNQVLMINNCSNLEELSCGNNSLIELRGIEECLNLTKLNCWDNQLTSLDVSSLQQLKLLSCKGNKLTNLDLTNCEQLEDLKCWDNQLIALNLSQNKLLTEISCSENELTQLILPQSDNLHILVCFNNQLTSLEFVQNLTKLEILDIKKNNITTGLEYLPLSLKKFNCDGEIWNELVSYGYNLRAWQQAHSDLMGNNLSLVNLQLTEQDTTPLAITATPNYLLKRIQEAEPITNPELSTNFNYAEFALRDNHDLAWENKNQEAVTSLPLRLYNFATKQVVTTENSKDIPHYLALSYMWGTDWEKQPQTYGQTYPTDLTKLGRKALNKAIKAWELIKQDSTIPLNYIWIDNFCIDQKNSKKDENGQTEKDREVKKQKRYYNNATATLIAIDGEILQKPYQWSDLAWTIHIIQQIVSSPWFTRAWTFQEGLLSKQTLFMFDDGLVDGRILAKIWAGIQDSPILNLNQTTIFSTPLGWSYGATKDHSVKLSLSQALVAVKHRQQTVALDGLYSILGLLPYGEQVTVNYENNTLEQTLQELMNLAINENSLEVISWWGERQNDELWTIPQINEDGSTQIEGFVNITAQPQALQIIKQEIWLVGGTSNSVNEEYITIVPNREQIVSDKWFEILVPKPEYSHLHLPIKVAESYRSTTRNDKIFIDLINKQVIEGEEEIAEYQAQIEIPPK